jgi:S1-C subfamily serine protease
MPAHPVAFDFASGFGLVMPLGPLRLPAIARGSASTIAPSDDVFVLGSGGRAHALKATVFAKREFAGYWEYLLDEALFATPAHPEWSGAALVGDDGRLVGIGSLLVQEATATRSKKYVLSGDGPSSSILDDPAHRRTPRAATRPWLDTHRRRARGKRPWRRGPRGRGGCRPGDVVVVSATTWPRFADMYRAIWTKGPAGAEIALTLARDGAPVRVRVQSGDRRDFLRKPRLQ